MAPLSDNTANTHPTHKKRAETPAVKTSKTFTEENDDFSLPFSPDTTSFLLSTWRSDTDISNPLAPPKWAIPPAAPDLQDDEVSWSTDTDDGESWCYSDDDDDDDRSDDGDDTMLTPQVKLSCHPPQHLFHTTPQDWNGDLDSDEHDESFQDDKEFDSISQDETEFVSMSTPTRVSFSDEEPQIHFIPRTSPEDWSRLYYSCHELQKIVDERRLEEQENGEDENVELC